MKKKLTIKFNADFKAKRSCNPIPAIVSKIIVFIILVGKS